MEKKTRFQLEMSPQLALLVSNGKIVSFEDLYKYDSTQRNTRELKPMIIGFVLFEGFENKSVEKPSLIFHPPEKWARISVQTD